MDRPWNLKGVNYEPKLKEWGWQRNNQWHKDGERKNWRPQATLPQTDLTSSLTTQVCEVQVLKFWAETAWAKGGGGYGGWLRRRCYLRVSPKPSTSFLPNVFVWTCGHGARRHSVSNTFVEGILCDVFSQKCSAAWQGARGERLTVAIMLPSRCVWRKSLSWTCTQRSPSMVGAMQRVDVILQRSKCAVGLWFQEPFKGLV